MIFKSICIKNFRNFEDVVIDLSNRNIIFGLNDIGKSNFLSAIRYLLDNNYRKNGLIDSDFFNKDISRQIEIILSIDISDFNDDDNKKIRTMMKGAIPSGYNEILIRLESTFNEDTLNGDINLFWGVEIEELEEVPSNQSRYALDNYFNIIYIDSSIQLENTFKRYTKEILKNNSSLTEDERLNLSTNINVLNDCVSNLSTIKAFEEEMVLEYKKFRDEKNFNISIQSEIELSNIHSKLKPYILDERNENFPTSGDGRKKILAYTLLSMENRKVEERKINVFLVEELENHLHRSMQIALSYQIFADEIFKYLFMTTHSSLIVSQMDNCNLIKLYKESNVVGKSYFYQVPEEYKNLKQKLNQNLAEAIYADYVLLVEGPSEKILFERILKDILERYESFGGYILEVEGINFSDYYKVLKHLGIKIIVKTDNDLQKVKNKNECNLLGLNRCLKLIVPSKRLKNENMDIVKYDSDPEYVKQLKCNVFDKYPKTISNLKENRIYISRIDLENDLYEAIPRAMEKLAKDNNCKRSAVDYLQSAKLINMIELSKSLSRIEIIKIYNHERFECLKDLVTLCDQ